MRDRQLVERALGFGGSPTVERAWSEPPPVGFRPRRWKLVSTRLSRSVLLGLGVLACALALTWGGRRAGRDDRATVVRHAGAGCGRIAPDGC